MQAVVVQPGDRLSYEAFPDPVPKPGEVLVELKAAAVNRRVDALAAALPMAA